MILMNLLAAMEEDTLARPPHPVLSADARWAAVLLILCAAIILAAMIVGPVVRANTHVPNHDEPHAH